MRLEDIQGSNHQYDHAGAVDTILDEAIICFGEVGGCGGTAVMDDETFCIGSVVDTALVGGFVSRIERRYDGGSRGCRKICRGCGDLKCCRSQFRCGRWHYSCCS